jgi:hypothetical protein
VFTNEVFNSLDAVEDRLVEALVALENDKKLVASTTGAPDWTRTSGTGIRNPLLYP